MSEAGTPRTTHDRKLRRALLDEAGRILTVDGVAALSTRRLAAAVETSTTAIYTLFGGKEGLLRAVYREGFQELAQKLSQVPRTSDPLADLRELGRAYRRSALEAPQFYEVMFRCPAPSFDPPPEDQALSLGTLQTLVDAVARCLDEGALAPSQKALTDPAELAFQLWALVHGLVSLELAAELPGSREEADARYDRALVTMLRGLAP